MTTSAQIRAIVIAALKGATNAGQSVYSPFDWPTQNDSYPLILVGAPKERKESRTKGIGAPIFDVTTTIEIIGRTKSPALVNDAGSAVALAAAEVLKAQIETALINNTAAWTFPDGSQRISQFASVESELTTSSAGEMPVAELVMHIEVEFVQGPEDFYPITGDQIQGFDAGVAMPSGTVEPGFSLTF